MIETHPMNVHGISKLDVRETVIDMMTKWSRSRHHAIERDINVMPC
jgi:hypothetical protein